MEIDWKVEPLGHSIKLGEGAYVSIKEWAYVNQTLIFREQYKTEEEEGTIYYKQGGKPYKSLTAFLKTIK